MRNFTKRVKNLKFAQNVQSITSELLRPIVFNAN